ncbi:MAG: hypothetical protein HN413_18130 [Chloroflexi bacterium]|jgi:enterochelin esterase-like enzyme|nr:hypothetical protein [Chloroflexota bacterium]
MLIIGGILLLGLAACSGGMNHAGGAVEAPSPGLDSTPRAILSPTPSPSLFLDSGERGEVLIPSPTPTPTPEICSQTTGRVESGELATDLLLEPLKYRVYLPPCYAEYLQRQYPALYWLHGQTYTEDQWLRLGAAETADRLLAEGIIPPVVMIFPAEQDHYTPPTDNTYGEALLNALIPHIEREYRVRSERTYRAIGGLSRGGNWAIYLGISQYEHFGVIGAHSAPGFVNDSEQRLREWLRAIPEAQLPRIYLDTGADDRWRQYTLQLGEILTDENIPHEWHQFQGVHDENYWAAHLETYLRWYAQEW